MLKEYLKALLDMEKTVYTQNCIIAKIENEISGLCKSFNMPLPEEPSAEPKKSLEGVVGWALLGAILSVIGIVICIKGFGYMIEGFEGFIKSLFLFIPGAVFKIGAIVIFALPVEDAVNLHISRKRACLKERSVYEREMKAYNSEKAKHEQRFREESAKKEYLISELKIMREQNKRSKANLERLYASMSGTNYEIPKQYRTLACISSLYDYIDTRVCSRLIGNGGAFDKLREEILAKKIITAIDDLRTTLHSDLVAIQNSQYTLYSALTRSNREVTKVLNTINQNTSKLSEMNETSRRMMMDARENSAVMRYNAERSRKELEYVTRFIKENKN